MSEWYQYWRSPLSMEQLVEELRQQSGIEQLPNNASGDEPRYAVRLPLTLRALNADLSPIGDSIVAVLKEVSEHGMCAVHRQELVGDLVLVKFFSPLLRAVALLTVNRSEHVQGRFETAGRLTQAIETGWSATAPSRVSDYLKTALGDSIGLM